MKRSLVALALAVPLVLTGCGAGANNDDGTTTEGNQDNQIQQPDLPEGVTGVPTPGDDADGEEGGSDDGGDDSGEGGTSSDSPSPATS